jgi:CotH kinase protein
MNMPRIWREAWLVGRVCASLCLVLACLGGTAAAEPPPGEAGWMYEAGTVVAIDLELLQEKKEELEAEPDEYVKGTFSLSKTDGTPGGTETPVASLPVEIKLKGNVLGSFRELDKKAAFKLKFGKEAPFLGLRKMTLNNMVEDYSSIHETLAYEVFRAAGIAAPRTGFAWVRLNGEDFGLYLNLENLDKINLERWFGQFKEPPQHLYEGEDGVDVEPGRAGEFEIDEGKKELSDLEALIAAVEFPTGPGWAGHVSPQADLEEMSRMWAVEKYIGHWDGYSGEETPLRPNNYYLYSDQTGRFQMLPWGTDNTWEPFKKPAFAGDAGLLFDDCVADPACEALYRRELRSVGKVAAGLNLDALAVQTADLLEPWEEEEQGNGRSEHDMSQIATGVDETREFIADRPAELAAFLGPEEESAPTGTLPSTSARSATVKAPKLHVGRSKLVGDILVTHYWFPGSGTVKETVELKTKRGRLKACTTRATVSAPGSQTLRCHLSAAILRRLHRHGLTLRVRTRFVPRSGAPESAFDRISLDRISAA